MENVENKFKASLDAIVASSQSDQDKISAISEIIANLNTLTQNAEISLAAETGAVLARKVGRPEMAAQFCLMRAKAEIAKAGEIIGEMKNLKMAIDWFGFALESASNRYKELEKKLNAIWSTTQALIDTGYKLLNEKPYVGAVGYCHSAAGQIYGSYYLQLKLYYFTTGRPWRARIGNYKISRWFGFDDFFIMDKKSRLHLKKVKKDCISSLHQAVKLFKREKAHQYVIDAYLDLVLEHHSFNDPIRSKFYMLLAKFLIRKNGLSKDDRLTKRVKSLGELPFIGSNRDIDISRQLPDLS